METETQASGWQLDQSSSDAYERYLVPRMFAPWADELVERTQIRRGERVLDVGCGTGIVARRAAPRVGADGEVVGLDLNEGMLRTARQASTDIDSPIAWQVGDALDLPYGDEAFDVVFCQQSLQFFPDQSKALGEMHRVLKPDGRLGVAVWRTISHNSAYAPVADGLERHVGSEAGAMMRSPFPDWDRQTLRGHFEEVGFDAVDINIAIGTMRYPSPAEFLRREAASSPLAGPIGQLDVESREALIDELEERLEPYTDDDGIVFPMQTHIVSARR